MFSENDKISLRQLKRLLVFDLFSVSVLIIPRIAAATAGRDGLITIILAVLYAIIYAWILLSFAKCTGGNYLEYSKKSLGSILTYLIGLVYMVKFSASCVFCAKLFGEIINETLLEDTDTRLIILILLIVSAYGASKGFEVRARIAEVLYYIIILPVFIFLILGLKEIQLSNLTPLFTESFQNIFLGGYYVFLTFSILEVLLFSASMIKFRKSDIKKGNRVFGAVTKAIVLMGILEILLFVVTLGILGRGETGQKLWSMVNVIQIIKMPGGFVQRQDAVILGIWMLSIYSILSAFFYYISFIGKFIFHLPGQNYLLVPLILLLFGVSVIPVETEQFFSYFENYMKFIGMPISLLIPAIVVFVGKVRKIKNTGSAKPVVKSLLMIMVLTSVVSFTGCDDMTEIEDRNFIQTMGVDLDGNELTVFYVLPDLKELTEQGSEDPEKLILKIKGYDFYAIEESYKLQYNKKLDFSHLKVIILGRNLAKNRTQMAQFLSYVENNYELGRNTLIFTSDTKAKDIIDLNKELQGGVGVYLDRLYRINLKNTGKKVVTIGDLVFAMNEGNPVTAVPVLKAQKKSLKTLGLGFFYHNMLSYEVGEEESTYTEIANGYGKNILLFLTENQDRDLDTEKKEYTEYVVKINNITRTLKFSRENNKPLVKINLDGTGIIEKGFKDKGISSDSANALVMEEIERRCNRILKEKISENIEKIVKEAGIDFMNLYRMTSYKSRSLWLNYAQKEDQFLKELVYQVEVDLKMQ